MLDDEFREAVRAVRDAAKRVLEAGDGAEIELRVALAKHLDAIKGFDMLTASGDQNREKLLSAARDWSKGSTSADRTRHVVVICDEATWFAKLY